MLKKIMQYFSNTSKSILILLVLIAYVFIPLADSIACNDCTDTCSFQGRRISYSNLINTGNPVLIINNTDSPGKSFNYKEEGKGFCPICYSTAGIFEHNHITLFSALYLELQPISIVLPEPSFPINKPPQN
jgi:hypothetical protein